MFRWVPLATSVKQKAQSPPLLPVVVTESNAHCAHIPCPLLLLPKIAPELLLYTSGPNVPNTSSLSAALTLHPTSLLSGPADPGLNVRAMVSDTQIKTLGMSGLSNQPHITGQTTAALCKSGYPRKMFFSILPHSNNGAMGALIMRRRMVVPIQNPSGTQLNPSNIFWRGITVCYTLEITLRIKVQSCPVLASDTS